MKKTVFPGMILICVISFNACTKVEENGDIMLLLSSSETVEYAESEESKSESTESEDVSSAQKQWKVNICSDIPNPYIDVLKQYEQFMNADNQNLNDESVQHKLWSGEWKDLYDELCGALISFINRDTEENVGDVFRYALTDITGDGVPEMIIAYRDIPEVIYVYSEINGIGKECYSSYYTMKIYDNGIVEYISGGAYSSTTYLQFQEDLGEWIVLETIASEGTWDSVNQEWINEKYYTGEWDGNGRLTDTISKEEYLRIQEKFVTEPMQFEWIPLIEKKSLDK